MGLFSKHKVVYVTNVKSEKKLVVTNIDKGKPLCKTKKADDLASDVIYYRNIVGVLVRLNGSPIIERVHAHERALLQVSKLISLGIPEDKIIGCSYSYTNVDNLTPKLITKEEFKTMKKQYKNERD